MTSVVGVSRRRTVTTPPRTDATCPMNVASRLSSSAIAAGNCVEERAEPLEVAETKLAREHGFRRSRIGSVGVEWDVHERSCPIIDRLMQPPVAEDTPDHG